MKLLLTLTITALGLATEPTIASPEANLSLVPLPQKLTQQAGPGFSLTRATTITYQGDDARGSAELLAAALRPATGLPLTIRQATALGRNTIFLQLDPDLEIGSLSSAGFSDLSRRSKRSAKAEAQRRSAYGAGSLSNDDEPANATSRNPPSASEKPGLPSRPQEVTPLIGSSILRQEGYTLESSASGIVITAPTPAGLFYGSQTLLQLLPAEVFQNDKMSREAWQIPAVMIKDEPALSWRGMMLDVSRYWFTKAYVLRYLDMMAMHKMNVLHWHLIDDCGWRIEIKKYPKLTEIGGFRGKGDARYGGYYTQDDIREIVRYAADRNITIVPEIELPAHTLPALVAYPELGCMGKQFEMPTRHSISPELYCAGKPGTHAFLRDVMTEVCDLFPGTFIHIGGDEAKYVRWKNCPDCQVKMKELGLKSELELQGWMTTQMEDFLAQKGKRIIGWDEILGCGVSEKAGIMTWHRPKTAINGAKRGNPVVMSLTGHAYFDTAESKLPGEPPTAGWIPPISLKKAYSWHPVPDGLTGDAVKNILGASGCVWTDQFLHKAHILADKPGEGTTKSEAYVDYLSLPRMAALAEVTWTKRELRDYDDFTDRMQRMYLRYTHARYNFRMPTPLLDIKKQSDGAVTITASSPIEGGTVRYTLDGTEPTTDSTELKGAVTASREKIFKTATFAPGRQTQSLTYTYADASQKYTRRGRQIGEWKSGQPGNGTPKEMTFDATGVINANGHYLITFLYTGGRQRLDIDGIKVVKNDVQTVAQDIHHGITGASHKNNTYKIKIDDYETGASFKVKAQVYGDTGDDTNGIVLIRPIE